MLSKPFVIAGRDNATKLCQRVMATRKITQIALAQQMGFNNTYVSDVFRGRRGWSPAFVESFIKTCKLDDDQRKNLLKYAIRANGWDIRRVE